jgi:hypothetical protein
MEILANILQQVALSNLVAVVSNLSISLRTYMTEKVAPHYYMYAALHVGGNTLSTLRKKLKIIMK